MSNSPESSGARRKQGLTRRDLLKGVAGLGAVSIASGCATTSHEDAHHAGGGGVQAARPDLIRHENAKPGTRAWMLTQDAPGKLNGGTYTATVYPGPRNNFVFNASSCWWADGISAPPGYVRPSVYTNPQGPDARVQQITANILNRMQG